MTKLHLFGFVLLIVLCGCGDSEQTPLDEACSRAKHLIGALSTNATVRAIVATEAIRTDLANMADNPRRIKIIDLWKRSVYDIPVDNLKPSDRYKSVSEAYRVVAWSVVGAMWNMRESYEEAWDVYLEAICWLDVQCRKMKPTAPQKGFDVLIEKDKWKYYRAIAEYRESVIENLEINGFDERIYRVTAERMDAAKRRFEIVIGRPVRPREEIKLLGHYVKVVREKILQEMERALSSERD